MAENKSTNPESSEDETPKKSVENNGATSANETTPADQVNQRPGSAPPLKSPTAINVTDDSSDATPVASKTNNDGETPAESLITAAPIDDQVTDEAVDDIAAKESDTVLAVEDSRNAKKAYSSEKPGWKAKLKRLLKNKWTWAGVALLLIIIFALPFTRYPLLGLVLKKPVTITVIDSKTNTPVSSAEVQMAGVTGKTDANGRAHLKVSLGKHSLQVSKQYYQALSGSYFVGFKAPAQSPIFRLSATGRLVPITVLNRITGAPLSNAVIMLKGTTAKTNSKGLATIALPTTASSYGATITLNGYNSANITVQVTDLVVKANSFQLTPAGHIYFLSNLSGNIDVVKANLDGSGRSTVMAGTGHEQPNTTSLLASRDWRYLVLESSRDGGPPALYLIDTSTDKSTEFENSGGNIRLVGWYDHNFIYDLNKTSQSNWQASREALKSYDADNLQLNQLDQNQAEGSASSYAYQSFANFYIVSGFVVYSSQWTTFNTTGTTYDTTGKTDSIRAVAPNGQNKKDYQTFPVATTGYIQAQLYSPQAIYYSVYDNSNGSTNYYQYQNQSVQTASINNGTYSASYPTYLVSPSGNQTFWTVLLDGQNALFTGDNNGSNKKQIASLSGYSPYGWYSDNYVLISKDSSQLYIMPSTGLASNTQPLKITDYFKPPQTYNGYGYGYGGL